MNLTAGPAFVLAVLLAAPLLAGQPAADEKEVWSLEDTYWRYVQTNDLEHYRTLWHRDFLGWPLSNPEPAHKGGITDWINAHTSKGETLKSYKLDPLAAQATGNHVTVAHRIHMTWLGRDGAEKASVTRVIHTWLQDAGHTRQIISGMAAPTNAEGH
jgi:Domain of unknown function (DUF4440)